MSSQTTSNQSTRPNTSSSSPSTHGVLMASPEVFQSTCSSTPTVNSSATQKSPSSILKPLQRFVGSPNSFGRHPDAGVETKAEKKARKQREQEAKMTPEVRLANLMKSYGTAPTAMSPSNFGGKY
ncbi:hypothetical protein FRB96_003653 [Tulasnella sp. 330]|nr:hypothetical protein FRB96_003653 [Tulasnella sp. 330]